MACGRRRRAIHKTIRLCFRSFGLRGIGTVKSGGLFRLDWLVEPDTDCLWYIYFTV